MKQLYRSLMQIHFSCLTWIQSLCYVLSLCSVFLSFTLREWWSIKLDVYGIWIGTVESHHFSKVDELWHFLELFLLKMLMLIKMESLSLLWRNYLLFPLVFGFILAKIFAEVWTDLPVQAHPLGKRWCSITNDAKWGQIKKSHVRNHVSFPAADFEIKIRK